MKTSAPLFCFLALLVATVAAADRPPYGAKEPVGIIAPTQMDIGVAHVGFSVEKVHKRAIARELQYGLSDDNLLEAILSRPLPGFYDPDRRFRIRDGHHWGSAATLIERKYGPLAPRIRVSVLVEEDFRDRSWLECARYMYRKRIGYFRPEVRALFAPFEKLVDGELMLPDDKLVELYTGNLGATLDTLRNNPGRSAAGMAIERMGIVPEHWLEDYIEFYMAEDFTEPLRRTDVDLNRFLRYETVDEATLGRVEALIATRPEVIYYLLERTRPGVDHRTAQRELLKAINHYRRKELGFDEDFLPAKWPPRRERPSIISDGCSVSLAFETIARRAP